MTFQRTEFRVILLTLVALLSAYGRPSQIVVVSPTIGNPVRSGNDLLSALAGITAPSASNPWLLKIEPGIYDLGTQALTMRPYVDVEDSGNGVTIVRSAGKTTVITSSNAELRELTVRSAITTPQTDPYCNSNCFAILADTGVNARITDVVIEATGLAWGLSVKPGAFAKVAGGRIDLPNFAWGVVNEGNTSIDGTEIRVVDLLSVAVSNGATLRLTNASVYAAPGSTAVRSTVAGITDVHHSILNGDLLEVLGGTLNVGASQVLNPGAATSAKCVASYDAAFDPVGSDCQPLP